MSLKNTLFVKMETLIFFYIYTCGDFFSDQERYTCTICLIQTSFQQLKDFAKFDLNFHCNLIFDAW